MPKRFCKDYRRLNDVTIKDAYPLLRTDQSLYQPSSAELLSCYDLNSGYLQVEVEKYDRVKQRLCKSRVCLNLN